MTTAREELDRAAPDDELARRCAAGDHDAFAALYQRYAQPLYDFALRTLRDTDTAADVLQNTFVRAWESLVKAGPPRHPRAWLFAIARNAAIDELRHRRRHVAVRGG